MPKFPWKLSPGGELKYGANIPFEEGTPKTSIKSYRTNCDQVAAAPAAPPAKLRLRQK